MRNIERLIGRGNIVASGIIAGGIMITSGVISILSEKIPCPTEEFLANRAYALTGALALTLSSIYYIFRRRNTQ